jgi:hypothetical protein
MTQSPDYETFYKTHGIHSTWRDHFGFPDTESGNRAFIEKLITDGDLTLAQAQEILTPQKTIDTADNSRAL